ncbi:hypothetical protein J6590_008219 [Homalodisca vitripennis]|nr:hypothetical protein J6590_008219 [Homalodisca vitripennis]
MPCTAVQFGTKSKPKPARAVVRACPHSTRPSVQYFTWFPGHSVVSTSLQTIIDSVFLYKILNGMIECPEILQMIDLRHVPRRNCRSIQLFAKRHHHSNYSYHSAVPRMMRSGIGVCSDVDFFDLSPHTFRRDLHAALVPLEGQISFCDTMCLMGFRETYTVIVFLSPRPGLPGLQWNIRKNKSFSLRIVTGIGEGTITRTKR